MRELEGVKYKPKNQGYRPATTSNSEFGSLEATTEVSWRSSQNHVVSKSWDAIGGGSSAQMQNGN